MRKLCTHLAIQIQLTLKFGFKLIFSTYEVTIEIKIRKKSLNMINYARYLSSIGGREGGIINPTPPMIRGMESILEYLFRRKIKYHLKYTDLYL